MTAHHDPDEIASHLVDGLLSGVDAERAAAEPRVRRRVEEMRRVRDGLRDVPPPDAAAKARAVAAALDAAPTVLGSAGSADGVHARYLRLAAAALVVLVALATGLFLHSRDDGADVTATGQDLDAAEQEVTSDAAEGEADPGAESRRQDGVAATPGAADDSGSAHAVDLGYVADGNELVAAVEAWLASSPREADRVQPVPGDREEATGSTGGCPQRSPGGDPRRGTPAYTMTATVEGESVWVHVYVLDSTRSWMVATDEGCNDVVERAVRAGS